LGISEVITSDTYLSAVTRGSSLEAESQTLLDQSIMWSQKVTNLWCDSEVKFLSNDYTNPNTIPRTLKTLTLTLTDPHDAFESFCAPVVCDFIWNPFGIRTQDL